jgi:hypothetical protein
MPAACVQAAVNDMVEEYEQSEKFRAELEVGASDLPCLLSVPAKSDLWPLHGIATIIW